MLDWERASEVVKTATHRGVGVCYSRHKMEHLGRDCDAPKVNCMTFGGTARQSLARHGFARETDVPETLDCWRRRRPAAWSSSARTCSAG